MSTVRGQRTGAAQAGQSAAPGKRPRGPGFAYATLGVVLFVLLATFSLTARQNPPPTIAEFAPRAVEQITDAEQGRSAGSGGDVEEPDERVVDPVTGLPPDASTVDVARVRRCVGDPPRQIEDPQSPPCVPFWEGDNGGATSRGVTRDEIRVTNPFGASAALAAFFNKRFEFYGRHIRLMPRTVPTSDPPVERAAARAAYEEDKSFASLGGGFHWNYFDELARLGIVGAHFADVFPESYLARSRPFLWLYPMANDRLFAMMGNWYCARFSGRNAVHAGDPLLQGSRRKLGIILTRAGLEGTSTEPMTDQLAACGEHPTVIRGTVQTDADSGSYNSSFMQNAMLQFKSEGVTSVACLGNVVCEGGEGMRAATQQGYLPEWLMTNYISNDITILVRGLGPPEQMRNLMMMLTQPMERAHPDHPANWALIEAGASDYPTTSLNQFGADTGYRMLLLIASGIQMAGPRLTPQTFEAGLHKALFPNPPHRIMAGDVGFADGDHSMTDDVVEVWWSNTARSPYPEDGVGTYCYVDGGARRRMGTFPADDPFFRGECDNGAA